jgi:Fe-S cluster assembly scaffold protein SufB
MTAEATVETTAEANAATTPPHAVRRRAPVDLPFDFATPALLDELVAARSEPAWLRAERAAALVAFEALPIETNPLYTTYVDLRPADLFEARPWLASESEPSGATRTLTADADSAERASVAARIELREDRVTMLELSDAARAAGVIVETFGAALARDPDGLRSDLEQASAGLPADDKLAQLTRALWSQGVRVFVPAGVLLERPILVRWASGNPDRALLSRTLVRLGAGAQAALVEELVPSGADLECSAGQRVPQGLFSGTTEVVLEAGARLDVAAVQELGPRQVVVHHRTARLADDATLRWAIAQVGGRLTRTRIDNRLDGDRSRVEQVEIIMGGGEQRFDLTAYTRHVGRDTTGDLLAKGALLDGARSVMKGLSTIEKSAVGTDSFLGEFGMNLTRQARSVAIPSLEIDQPDCRRAAHSSAVGPIDPAALFYLESRGIAPDQARRMIVLGFLEPVVARIPLETVQERVRSLLDAKWSDSASVAASEPVSPRLILA